MDIIIICLISYLMGSIPFGFISGNMWYWKESLSLILTTTERPLSSSLLSLWGWQTNSLAMVTALNIPPFWSLHWLFSVPTSLLAWSGKIVWIICSILSTKGMIVSLNFPASSWLKFRGFEWYGVSISLDWKNRHLLFIMARVHPKEFDFPKIKKVCNRANFFHLSWKITIYNFEPFTVWARL